MFNFNRKEKGQGLVEYALILVLVAVIVIVVLQVLGPLVGSVFTEINSGLTVSSAGGGGAAAAAVPTADLSVYADEMATPAYNSNDAINHFCTGKPSGVPYKLYNAPIFAANQVGGVNTSPPANYSQIGTGTCP